jgi:endonuclease YncB( thermonuclease family)
MREVQWDRQSANWLGLDAPEAGQECTDGAGQRYPYGQKAALVLDARITDGVVTCETKYKDRFGRRSRSAGCSART